MSKLYEASEAIRELEELKDEIETKIGEFRCKLEEALDADLGYSVYMDNLDFYVFKQLQEHIDNGNPYNQSLQSIINGLHKQLDNGYPFKDEDDDDE